VKKQLLTTEQIAQYLQVSPRTLATWRDEDMPHIAITARSYRYDLEKVQEWLEERDDNISADRDFDHRDLGPSHFKFYSELMDGAAPETWDHAVIRDLLSQPIDLLEERHRVAMDEFMIARWVETGGDEQHARRCQAMSKRIMAAHESDAVRRMIADYEDEKFGEDE
jgi:excisionase family DNA binding protein